MELDPPYDGDVRVEEAEVFAAPPVGGVATVGGLEALIVFHLELPPELLPASELVVVVELLISEMPETELAAPVEVEIRDAGQE